MRGIDSRTSRMSLQANTWASSPRSIKGQKLRSRTSRESKEQKWAITLARTSITVVMAVPMMSWPDKDSRGTIRVMVVLKTSWWWEGMINILTTKGCIKDKAQTELTDTKPQEVTDTMMATDVQMIALWLRIWVSMEEIDNNRSQEPHSYNRDLNLVQWSRDREVGVAIENNEVDQWHAAMIWARLTTRSSIQMDQDIRNNKEVNSRKNNTMNYREWGPSTRNSAMPLRNAREKTLRPAKKKSI